MTAGYSPEIERRLGVSFERIAAFCSEHGIDRCDLFGSSIRPDFRADSDVDVLVTFRPGHAPSLFGRMRLERAMETLFGRSVDLVTMGALESSENHLLREEILSTRRVVYVDPT